MKIEIEEKTFFDITFVALRPRLNQFLPTYESDKRHYEIYAWCVNSFGPMGKHFVGDLNIRWYTISGKYYFRNPSDATAFLLRWE